MRFFKAIVTVAALIADWAVSAGDCGHANCLVRSWNRPRRGLVRLVRQICRDSDALNVLQGACGWDRDNVQAYYNTCGGHR